MLDTNPEPPSKSLLELLKYGDSRYESIGRSSFENMRSAGLTPAAPTISPSLLKAPEVYRVVKDFLSLGSVENPMLFSSSGSNMLSCKYCAKLTPDITSTTHPRMSMLIP